MNSTTYHRKVKANVKRLNQSLREDVFGDRFSVRQIKQCEEEGITYYQYKMLDKEQPERNTMIRGWLTYWDICSGHKLHMEINDFIIHSDFWTKYRQEAR